MAPFASVGGPDFGERAVPRASSFKRNARVVPLAKSRTSAREQVAELALGSAFFEQLAGSRSNAAVVTLLHDNVFGTVPSDVERDYFVGMLDRGMSQADLLLLAVNSDLNGFRVDIAGLAQTGIEYA